MHFKKVATANLTYVVHAWLRFIKIAESIHHCGAVNAFETLNGC